MKKFLASSRIYQLYAVAGGLCMVLQWIFLGAEDEKGLLPRGHWTGWLVWLLVAVALAAAIYVGRDRKFPQLPAHVRAAGGALGALGILISGITMLVQGEWITAVAAILCALAVGYIALCRYRRLRSNFLAYGVGAVFLMCYLISHYQMWSAEPENGRYALLLLALVFLMLAFYQKAALGAGVGNPGAHHIFSAMAMMLSFGAIPGAQHPLLFAGMGSWLLLDPTVRVRKRKKRQVTHETA
jgi:hypothetical protein